MKFLLFVFFFFSSSRRHTRWLVVTGVQTCALPISRCANPTTKDLLPDLIHDRLSVAWRTEVEAHLSTCAECRSELTILRHVVAVAAAPRIDVARIASALPHYRARSPWQRAVHSTQLRIA